MSLFDRLADFLIRAPAKYIALGVGTIAIGGFGLLGAINAREIAAAPDNLIIKVNEAIAGENGVLESEDYKIFLKDMRIPVKLTTYEGINFVIPSERDAPKDVYDLFIDRPGPFTRNNGYGTGNFLKRVKAGELSKWADEHTPKAPK